MSVIIDQDGKRFDHLLVSPTFVWQTPSSSAVWTVVHNLDKYPAVATEESTGAVIQGRVHYIDRNSLSITFLSAITGKVFLN